MEKVVFNVGIIDDDETKRTQIISKLEDFVDGAPAEIRERYEDYSLNPVELEIKSDISELLEQVVEEKIDALIVDYKLASFELAVDYNGVGFANFTEKKYMGFPVFVLTSFETELYQKEVFDAYKIYDFERYLNEDNERIEINTKIVEQCVKRKKQIDAWKNQIKKLLPRQGESKEIDYEILQLDSNLEKSLDGENAIPDVVKDKLTDKSFDLLISKLDELLKGE